MFLAQISDTHLLSLSDSTPLALNRAENLQRCVDTINQMPTQPAAILHTGDMVNFDEKNDYGLAFEILSQLNAPFYPTIGNRDSRPDLIARFLTPDVLAADASFCQYRIKLAQADLICVDTKSATRNIGAFCEKRRADLEELLRQDTNKPVFVFMHHPPAPIEALKNPLQFESIEQATALTDLLDQYNNVVRFLCGHTHRSDMLNMGRHAASTIPSLATDVRLDCYPERLTSEPVFQLHELHSNHTVTSMSHFSAPARAA